MLTGWNCIQGVLVEYDSERRLYAMRKKLELLRKQGQSLVEYALILVLISIVVITLLSFVGRKISLTFSRIASGLG